MLIEFLSHFVILLTANVTLLLMSLCFSLCLRFYVEQSTCMTILHCVLQVICLALLWVIKSVKAVSIVFPIMVSGD